MVLDRFVRLLTKVLEFAFISLQPKMVQFQAAVKNYLLKMKEKHEMSIREVVSELWTPSSSWLTQHLYSPFSHLLSLPPPLYQFSLQSGGFANFSLFHKELYSKTFNSGSFVEQVCPFVAFCQIRLVKIKNWIFLILNYSYYSALNI